MAPSTTSATSPAGASRRRGKGQASRVFRPRRQAACRRVSCAPWQVCRQASITLTISCSTSPLNWFQCAAIPRVVANSCRCTRSTLSWRGHATSRSTTTGSTWPESTAQAWGRRDRSDDCSTCPSGGSSACMARRARHHAATWAATVCLPSWPPALAWNSCCRSFTAVMAASGTRGTPSYPSLVDSSTRSCTQYVATAQVLLCSMSALLARGQPSLS
mmetsp:Transcript_34731/g.77232  ORF Transcript_34731/g.77232 Transcript_34731/m.77232 type:complete len:217 (+) Transcript_34731:3698-4348(+)